MYQVTYKSKVNRAISQSINVYRAIVQRRVLQCSYAESKRNVFRWIYIALYI